MSEQDQPYAYLAKPHWYRDNVEVFPDLASLVTRCDADKTFRGPDSVQIWAVYRAGKEVEVPKEVYSVPNPCSKEEAESFVQRRLDSDSDSLRRLAGLFRANPDLPFEDQVAQYVENSHPNPVATGRLRRHPRHRRRRGAARQSTQRVLGVLTRPRDFRRLRRLRAGEVEMPKLLDLFCGAGGAAMGYHRAGFGEIVGVDPAPSAPVSLPVRPG